MADDDGNAGLEPERKEPEERRPRE